MWLGFSTKGDRVAPSRWFGLIHALRKLLPAWHRKLVIMMFVAIQSGLFTKGSATGVLSERLAAKAKGASSDLASDAKSPGKQQSAEEVPF